MTKLVMVYCRWLETDIVEMHASGKRSEVERVSSKPRKEKSLVLTGSVGRWPFWTYEYVYWHI